MSTSSTVSSTLWAHLLRKDKPMTSISSAPLPIAPVDKTGTSVRLLLHDTQATLEKFSEKVDKLLKGLEDSRSKSLSKDQEWAEEVERSTKLVIDDAIKKCETKLQNTLMEPAQVSQITEFRKSIMDNIERLHAKVDMIQMLNQTQSQALQTIQDQQGQILTALLPLMPLLQTIPLHIESGNNILKGVIQSTAAKNDILVNRVSMKRKSDLSYSLDPSISKKPRVESGFTTKQLPSPSRSRDAKSGSSPFVNAQKVSSPTPSVSTTPLMQRITNSIQRQASLGSILYSPGMRKHPVSTTPFNSVKLQNKAPTPVTTEVQLPAPLSHSSATAKLANRISFVDRRPMVTPIRNNKTVSHPSSLTAPDGSALQNNVCYEVARSSGSNAGSAKASRSGIDPFDVTHLSMHNRLANDNTANRSTRLQPYAGQVLITQKPGKRFIPLVDDDSDEEC